MKKIVGLTVDHGYGQELQNQVVVVMTEEDFLLIKSSLEGQAEVNHAFEQHINALKKVIDILLKKIKALEIGNTVYRGR